MMRKTIIVICVLHCWLLCSRAHSSDLWSVWTDGESFVTLYGSDGTNPVAITFQISLGEGLHETNGTTWFGTAWANRVEIDGSGCVALKGTATVWDDMRVPMNSLRLSGSKPPAWVEYKGGQVLAFSDESVSNNEEVVYFAPELHHDYKEGSDLCFHPHWIPEDGATGAVHWMFTYSWANIDATFPSPTTLATNAVSPGVADQHTVTDFTDLSGTGKTISSVLICSFRRNSSNAGDTLTGKDAYLLTVDFHYEIDSLGSNTEDAK